MVRLGLSIFCDGGGGDGGGDGDVQHDKSGVEDAVRIQMGDSGEDKVRARRRWWGMGGEGEGGGVRGEGWGGGLIYIVV